jgi:hypothetical protein
MTLGVYSKNGFLLLSFDIRYSVWDGCGEKEGRKGASDI